MEESQKHVPPASMHTFMVQNQEEQTKLTQILTIYLSFIHFEDKHIIFRTLGEWQSCSWFLPLFIPMTFCFLLLLESNAFLSQESLNTKGKKNNYEHKMVSAPFFNVVQGTEQITTAIRSFR